MRITLLLNAVLFVNLSAGLAQAQHNDDQVAAEQLFTEGRMLMEHGDFDQACRKFEASHQLDPAVGTLLNLALCHQEQGKVASAWALYRQAADMAQHEGQQEREAEARNRAKALQPELPRLVIKVPTQGRVPGLTIERNGSTVDATLFDTPVYVDPGAHRIVARAPGHKEWVTETRVEKSKQAIVTVPVLQPMKQKASGQDAVKDVGRDAKAAAAPGVGGGETKKPGRTRKLVGLGMGGAGIAAMAVGLGFGWSAKTTWDDAFSSGLCSADSLACMAAGQKQTDKARSRALASNILVSAGVALAATGVVLFVTAPKRAENASITVTPMAGPNELGVALQGGF